MSLFQAEFFGTFLLLLLGTSVVANVVLKGTKGNNGGWIVITTGWGLAVFTGVVVAGPYSGAHLNPAVTLALAIAGKFDWSDVPMYLVAQMLGAMSGAFVTWAIYRQHFDITEDATLKLAVFSTNPAIRNTFQNLISEMAGTFVLLFAIFYITAPEMADESRTPIGMGSLGAIPVAFLVWVIGLALGGTTGYAINPARDLGPRMMHAILPIKNKASSDWSYAWIPVVGPFIGGCIAALLFVWLS